MRNVIAVLLVCVGAFLILTNAQSQTPPVTPHYYGLEHGVIQYAISGVIKGTETFYFDQWGLRQAHQKVAETPRWGTTTTVTLNLGAEIIMYDLSKNIGQKKEDANFKKLLADYKPEDTQLLSLQALALIGGKKIGDESFLELACEVWQTSTPQTKMWLFNGIPLKIQTQTSEGEVIFTAISLDQTTVVDESLFVVPPDIRFIDRDINEILISQCTGKLIFKCLS